MRSTVVALGLALAIGGLAYGSSRRTPASLAARAPVGALVPADADLPLAGAPPPPPVRSSRVARARVAAGSIAAQVHAASRRYGVPEGLVAAVISVESEFNPRAVSQRGALGLMQLMPSTAALLGVRDAFDPAENVDAGARHLRDLLDRFANDVSLALAAYNAGPYAVVRHGGIPPYPETRAFVARVLSRVGRVVVPGVQVAEARPVAPPRVRVNRFVTAAVPRADESVVALRADDPLVAATIEDARVAVVSPPVPAPAPPPPPIQAPPAAVSEPAMARIESP
jgi:hypothetical protein